MRRLALAALASLLALVAGCAAVADSGIPSAGGTVPDPSASRDVLGEMRRWAQCMAEHGIDLPAPYLDPQSGKYTFGFEGPGKGEPGADQYQAADQACLPYATWTQDFADPQPLSDEQLRLYREWAQCMRDHGVDQADPGPYGFDDVEPTGRDPRAEEPQAGLREQAEAACMDKFLAARMAE
jgi:hypothetical protein